MSARSFSRHGRPLRKVGYCSFMASMPVRLIAGTAAPSRTPGSSPKESGGNSQSDQRPLIVIVPSGWRSKYAVLNGTPSQLNSHDSGCPEPAWVSVGEKLVG
jgi:hypothetical protein